MPATHLQTEQRLAVLIKLIVPGLGVKRYQNWCEESYFFRGEPYEPLAFDRIPFASRRLDFGNIEAEVYIGNERSRYDVTRPVREWLRIYDGWRRGDVEIFHLWPDDPSAPAVENRMRILSSDIGEQAIIRLRSPVEAVNALIPSFFASNQIIPELPHQEAGHKF